MQNYHENNVSAKMLKTAVCLCCSQKLLRSPRKPTRKISKIPFKVLDAPELQDDFYLNLVDWSSLNVLSVGLGTCVYLWSACTSQVCVCACVCVEYRQPYEVRRAFGSDLPLRAHHGHYHGERPDAHKALLSYSKDRHTFMISGFREDRKNPT